MYCSVKFLEPTVTWTPLLSGFSSIRLALVSPPSPSSSSSPPHAATPSARTSAANNANSKRTLDWLIIRRLLPSRWMQPQYYLGRGGCPLHKHPARREQPLDARERELDRQREQRDHDRPGEHPVVAVDVAVEDQIAERLHADERRDRRRRDDRDGGRAHAAHQRRDRERKLDPGDDPRLGHAHPPRGLDRIAVHLADRHERVGEDRRDAEDQQRDREVDEADADERHHERDQRQLRHGPAGVPDRHGEQLALAAVAEPDPHRHRDHERARQGERTDLEVVEGEIADLRQAADGAPAGDPGLLLVEDEIDRAGERVQEAEGDEVGAHTGRTLRHGDTSLPANTSSTSNAIAIRIASPPERITLVLKLMSA